HHRRKNPASLLPATCSACGCCSTASGAVPATPCTRSSVHPPAFRSTYPTVVPLWFDGLARDPRRAAYRARYRPCPRRRSRLNAECAGSRHGRTAAMRVAEVTRFGPPEVLVTGRRPDPVPGPRDVVIAVAAADTLWVETLIRSGAGQDVWPMRPPYVP